MWHCLRDPMFSHFDTIPACDRQMDGQTMMVNSRSSIASHGYKWHAWRNNGNSAATTSHRTLSSGCWVESTINTRITDKGNDDGTGCRSSDRLAVACCQSSEMSHIELHQLKGMLLIYKWFKWHKKAMQEQHLGTAQKLDSAQHDTLIHKYSAPLWEQHMHPVSHSTEKFTLSQRTLETFVALL